MFALLASLILAQFPAAMPETVRLEGRCTYPPELIERAAGTWLVPCGEATLAGDSITFASRGFAPAIRFVGEWDGSELVLHHVARRGQDEAEAARGWCRLDFRGEDISAIVCTAVAGPRSYIANLIVPNI